MQALRDFIIIKITKEERRKIFEKDIITAGGKKITLITSLEYETGCADCGLQTVGYGEVVSVGPAITNIQPLDTVLVDYSVEMNKGIKLPIADPLADYYRVRAVTTYHLQDYVIGNNNYTHTNRYLYRSGEIDAISPVIAVVRNGRIIANDPYVLLEYQKPESRMVLNAKGLYLQQADTPVIIRKSLGECPDEGISPGESLIVNDADIFERSIDGKVFSVIYKNDIYAKITQD